MIVALSLNPALDVVYDVETLTPGRTRTGIDAIVVPAGKGINVAKVARALGEPAAVVGLMPENDRRRFEAYLEGLDIEPRLLAVPGDVRINATVLETRPPRVTHLNAASRNLFDPAALEITAFVERHAAAGDVVALSGSLPPGMPPDMYAEIIAGLEKAGCRTVLDTSGEALRQGVRAGPEAVKPNREELAELTGAPADGDDALWSQVEAVLSSGPRQVFVSLGAGGLVAANGRHRFRIGVPSIDVVDTVGAGDAMVAGILVGMARALPFADTCRLCAAAALSSCLHRGAGHIDPDEVSTFQAAVRVDIAARHPV